MTDQTEAIIRIVGLLLTVIGVSVATYLAFVPGYKRRVKAAEAARDELFRTNASVRVTMMNFGEAAEKLALELADERASNARLLSANEALKARLQKYSADKPRDARGHFLPSKGNGVGAVG